MNINSQLKPEHLADKINNLRSLSGDKLKSMTSSLKGAEGSPVVTVNGTYKPRSWTDWTQGFQFGSELFQYNNTGDSYFLDLAIDNIKTKMTSHVSHFGVHDFQATVMRLLGIDHEQFTFKHQGRRYRLTDVHGNVVKDILS